MQNLFVNTLPIKSYYIAKKNDSIDAKSSPMHCFLREPTYRRTDSGVQKSMLTVKLAFVYLDGYWSRLIDA